MKCAYIIKVLGVTKFLCRVFSTVHYTSTAGEAYLKKLKRPHQVWSHLTFWAPQRSLGSHTQQLQHISQRTFHQPASPERRPQRTLHTFSSFSSSCFWTVLSLNPLILCVLCSRTHQQSLLRDLLFLTNFKILLGVNVTVVEHPILCSLWLFHHKMVL